MMEKQEISYSFEYSETVDCRIAKDWERAGTRGQYFGYVYVSSEKWAIIQFDEGEDPELHKAESIEIAQPKWINVKHL